MKLSTRNAVRLLTALFFVALSACGGGNGGAGAPMGGGEGGGSLKAELTISINPSSGIIPINGAATVDAILTDKFGNLVKNQLVTFTITPENTTAAVFLTPGGGFASTGETGVAQVIVGHGTTSGAGEINATATFNDTDDASVTVSNNVAFQAQ